MEQKKENWLLKKINEQIENNGKIDEACLKLIYTQIHYHNEFLHLIKEFEKLDNVSTYLYIVKNNDCMEFLDFYKKKEKVQTYLYMANQISMVDEVIEFIRNSELFNHILVSENNEYQCIRCGVKFQNEVDSCLTTDAFEYDEARMLYENIARRCEYCDTDSIIDEMLLLRNKNKVKRKHLSL